MTAHAWRANVVNGGPAMTCTNPPCRIVWWPDRNMPKSQCKGTPFDPAAVVRALMIGGAV